MSSTSVFPQAITNQIVQRLDEAEVSLPPIPSKMIRLSRNTVGAVADGVCGAAAAVQREIGKFSSTANTAGATVGGQGRSVATRTSKAATAGVREVSGQARAQAQRVAGAAGDGVEDLLDDANGVVDRGSPKPQRLDDLSKADLYERARDLDIEGRSTMSKRELIGAIRAAR
jgi:hypothetical protein